MFMENSKIKKLNMHIFYPQLLSHYPEGSLQGSLSFEKATSTNEPRASPQQSDLRLSGPPSSTALVAGARIYDRQVLADFRAVSLSTGPPPIPYNTMKDLNKARDESIVSRRMANTEESLPALCQPSDLEKKVEKIEVALKDKTVSVHVVQTSPRQADASISLDVLFLHGGKYSSQDWLDIQSLDHVATWGYRAVAIDLPETGALRKWGGNVLYGCTSGYSSEDPAKKVSIFKFPDDPEQCRQYSLPFLFSEPKTSRERAVGYVPITPVSTQEFREHYPDSQLPTLIVYGTKDPEWNTPVNDFKLLPVHELAPIEDAGHACYLDQPDQFHKALCRFLKKLSCK
ncbi:abhydrolase domain containing 14b [Plakobranchus ocellatus]|uniref:Abhydrolase domain containing 14b n=1 Tax=Plakobranchus ocellatus TaxID=259542 RepID=A0AAV4B0H9_9GAST|nr:abhydrolase domain containing 14b [Plakobranchus ocellatus]